MGWDGIGLNGMEWAGKRWNGGEMRWDELGCISSRINDDLKVMSLIFKVNCYVTRAEELKQHLKQRSASKIAREPGHVLSE